MNVKFCYKDGKKKALTFSFDDGVIQDVRLINLFNKYNVKGTFNLNSGLLGSTHYIKEIDFTLNRLNQEEIKDTYIKHEVAIHSKTHPFLTNLNDEMLDAEIFDDKNTLESLVGYKIKGAAYPFNDYNDKVISKLKAANILYARNTNSIYKFDLPTNFYLWNPTCHYMYDNIIELCKNYLEYSSNELSCFYIWGHSYEFDQHDNWNIIEDVLKVLSNNEDIYYATNIEICEYVVACRNLIFTDSYIENNSNIDLYLEINNQLKVIKALSKYYI